MGRHGVLGQRVSEKAMQIRKDFELYLLENEPENKYHEVVRLAGICLHNRRCRALREQEEAATGLACWERAVKA